MYKDDDMCAQCGGIRIAKSTLCADCLAMCNVRVHNENVSLQTQADITEGLFSNMLDEKNDEVAALKYQLKLTRKILRHVFHEYQELQKLKAIDIMA